MKNHSIADYLAYSAFKLIGPFIRMMPLGLSLFLGRRLGELMYLLDVKHRCLAYANMRRALGDKIPHCRLRLLVKDFYRNFGQNLVEIFIVPLVNE